MTSEVIAALISELEYIDLKFPKQYRSTAEWLLIIEREVREAKRKWLQCEGDEAALHELRQAAACCIKAMESGGAYPRGAPYACNTSHLALNRTETPQDASKLPGRPKTAKDGVDQSYGI